MHNLKAKFRNVDIYKIFRYLLFQVLLILLCGATTKSGLSPFGLGAFVALVYARQNILIIAPMYLVAILIYDFSLKGVIMALTPALIFTTAYFLHHKFERRMNLVTANICVLLSQIPYVAYAVSEVAVYQIILYVMLSQIFAYVAIIAFYAILTRGLRYKLTVDEVISTFVVLGAAALALYGITYKEFNLFYLVYSFAVLVVGTSMPPAAPLFLGVVSGLGCAFGGGSVACVATCVILAATVAAFRNTNALITCFAVLAADVLLGYYFNAYSGYGYVNVIVIAAGAVVFLLLPKRYKKLFENTLGTASNARTAKTVINKNRQELSLKLNSLADIFEDMQVLLQGVAGVLPDTDCGRKRLAKDIAVGYCANCADCDACFSSLGSDTSEVIEGVLETAEPKGKASIIDMPPFITSRCKRLNGLIQTVNEKMAAGAEARREYVSLDRGKHLLATQMGGVASVFDGLAAEVRQMVSFDAAREKRIIDELTMHSVMCKEVIVYGEGGEIKVSALVGACDADKSVLIKAISKIMKVRLTRIGVSNSADGYVTIHLAPAPKFDFIYGEAFRPREGENLSGDTRCVKKISPSRVIFAVCDGMGSGVEAESFSSRAIQMVENFYAAGFQTEVVLSLVNKLLALKNDDTFGALDMCCLDLNTGACDFIKLGATYTVIKRRDEVELIEGRSLPLGIIEGVKPDIVRKILLSGDIACILSDGVTDVISEAELSSILSEHKGVNPQILADEIISAAVSSGASDDLTALVVRVFQRI